MIITIIGILLHFLLFNAIQDYTLLTSVLYHYSDLDILFLMSLLVSIYWLVVLYKCIFRYLDINQYIQIRLTLKEKVRFYLKRTLLFTIIYLIIQIIIMIYLNQYPCLDILYNLITYYLCIIIAFLFWYKKDYIFIFMFITVIIMKLI